MSLKEKLAINPEKICPKLESFIKEKMDLLKRDGVILGVSGGLDSAVTASLCVRAVGKDKVLALIIPERDSASETKTDAIMVAKNLGIKYQYEDLTPKLKMFSIYQLLPSEFIPRIWRGKTVRRFYELYTKKAGESPFQSGLLGSKGLPYADWLNKSNAYYRIKHRMRMVILYWQAELKNLLYTSCANNTEWLTGFFVKFGCDGAGDIMPLLPFYKTQVRELAKYLKVPKKIQEKIPSPDIMAGITDEYAMGISYDKLDLILVGLESKMNFKDIAKEASISTELVEYVNDLYKKSDHFRKVYVPEF